MTVGDYFGLGIIVVLAALVAVVLYDAITLLLDVNRIKVKDRHRDRERMVNPYRNGDGINGCERIASLRDGVAFIVAPLLLGAVGTAVGVGVLVVIGFVASHVHSLVA